MDKFPTNHMIKIGIVVRDIEDAVNAYADVFNIPIPEIKPPREWKQMPGEKAPGTIFRGRRGFDKIKSARIALDPFYIELIEPADDFGPWYEYLQKHGPGVFFMAAEASAGFSDVEEMMAKKNMPIFHKAEKGTQRYGYFDTFDKLGITLEFKEID
jgi:hypothetical protein